MAKTIRDNVVELFGERDDDIPETPLESAPSVAARPVSATGSAAVDLTGKPKIVMLFGAGRAGKSTVARLLCERRLDFGDGSDFVMATMDGQRQTLKRFFPSVLVPKSLEKLLGRLLETKRTAIIDMGADQTLAPILIQIPNLQQVMADAGVEPVALYLLTPRSGDLTVLKTMEDAGFRPTATALVLNEGTMDGSDPEQEFAQIRKHSLYRAAIERGAVEIWIRRLSTARDIEDRGLGFRQSTNGGALGYLARYRVNAWLDQTEEDLRPIQSWLP